MVSCLFLTLTSPEGQHCLLSRQSKIDCTVQPNLGGSLTIHPRNRRKTAPSHVMTAWPLSRLSQAIILHKRAALLHPCGSQGLMPSGFLLTRLFGKDPVTLVTSCEDLQAGGKSHAGLRGRERPLRRQRGEEADFRLFHRKNSHASLAGVQVLSS